MDNSGDTAFNNSVEPIIEWLSMGFTPHRIRIMYYSLGFDYSHRIVWDARDGHLVCWNGRGRELGLGLICLLRNLAAIQSKRQSESGEEDAM